jgi:oligopeptide transport system permease protein
MFFRRLAALFCVLFVVVTVTFFLMRLSPGNPFDRERELLPQARAAMEKKYHYDGTLWQQYTAYLGRLLHGDLGPSTSYRSRTVNGLLAQALPVSAALGSAAFVLATVGGVLLGGWAAVHRGQWGETGAMLAALLAISLPTFVTGPLLILLFALWLGWLPVSGWGGWSHLLLPAITLAGPYVAYIARLMRTSLLETLAAEAGACRAQRLVLGWFSGIFV